MSPASEQTDSGWLRFLREADQWEREHPNPDPGWRAACLRNIARDCGCLNRAAAFIYGDTA